MTRVHALHLLRYWLACAVDLLLTNVPGKSAVLAGRVAEEWDYTIRANEDIDASAKDECQNPTGNVVLPHLISLSFRG